MLETLNDPEPKPGVLDASFCNDNAYLRGPTVPEQGARGQRTELGGSEVTPFNFDLTLLGNFRVSPKRNYMGVSKNQGHRI